MDPFFGLIEQVGGLRSRCADRDLRIAAEVHAVLGPEDELAARLDAPFACDANEQRPVCRTPGAHSNAQPRDGPVGERRE